MSSVTVKENESLDSALRRFKRNCAKAGIQQEIRKREHYEKPSVDVKRSLKLLVKENSNNKHIREEREAFLKEMSHALFLRRNYMEKVET